MESLEISKSPQGKPVVIGIYGLPGSGKSFLLKQLKEKADLSERFTFYEGSKMIDSVVSGGLEAFQKLEDLEKTQARRRAIEAIRRECIKNGRAAIVTGHFSFWNEGDTAGETICTESDLRTYTHIIYLDVPAPEIFSRRLNDSERKRPNMSIPHLMGWQDAEKSQLRHLCYHHQILFLLMKPHLTEERLLALLLDFHSHTEPYNLSQAEKRLDKVISSNCGQLESMIVLDADRTLTAQDTGDTFWRKALSSGQLDIGESPLKPLFSSPLQYSYTAFRQATLLYEETMDDAEFENLCQQVASATDMHPEFVALLRLISKHPHLGAVVLTCGLRRVWDIVLERNNLSQKIQAIGGCRLMDGFVMTPTLKRDLVGRLQTHHALFVCAFGDSPLDLPMLIKADRAVVVVGEEGMRSKSWTRN